LWRRRWFWIVLLLILGVVGGAGGWWWYRASVPRVLVPTLDLHDSDPAVAEAIEKQRQNVLQHPHSAAAWGRLAEMLMLFNYRSESQHCFAEAERLDPQQPRWPYLQGVLLLMDKPNEALPKLERAVELSGDTNLAPRLRLCEALLSLGRIDEAEAGFRELKQREPENSRIELGLGRIALERRQWSQAQAHLEAAARDRYSARAALIALIDIHQRRGEEKVADELRGRLERLPPDLAWSDPYVEDVHRLPLVGKVFRLKRIDRLIEQGNIQEGIMQLNQVVHDYPDSTEAWFTLGQLLLRIGEHRPGAYAQAEQAMQKVVELSPGYAEAHNYLGAARRRQGKLKEAEQDLRKAIELKPDFAYAYANLGRCLTPQRAYADAIDAYRTAIRCKPDYTDAYVELAEVLHETRHDRDALEQVRLALQINPHLARAQQLLEKLEPKKQ
jgi:tetratricopeptide (TPR) repeat protein